MKNKLAILSLLALCAAGSAQAEDAMMRVNLADLNLATEAGAKTALARIRRSTANFCELTTGRVSLQRSSAVDRCVADMMHESIRQLNKPLVTALLEQPNARAMSTETAPR